MHIFSFFSVSLAVFIFTSPAMAMPQSFAELAASQRPAVVNISTTTIRNGGGFPPGLGGMRGTPFEDFFRHYFQQQQQPSREQHSLGSGFILSSDGYVVTNNHVVKDADEVVVKMSDGKEYRAEIVGTDPKLDVALLKIDAKKLTAVKIGDSDKLRVGDWVVAIGNPFGLEQTVTAGIVSAKGRVIGAGPYDSFIQTDAAINPGNSGGPLFNVAGELIGINTAIMSRGGGNNGIGFAIPLNLAQPSIDALRQTGYVQRARLGVHIEPVTKDTMMALDLQDKRGALVRQVETGSAADQAGVEAGDVIVAIDEHAIKRVHDLPIRVAGHKPGDHIKITLIRHGKKKTIDAMVEEMPDDQAVASHKKQHRAKLGLTLETLKRGMVGALQTRVKKGVVVKQVQPGSPAARAGFEKGDVIYRINRQAVGSVAAFEKALRTFVAGDVIQLMLDRHGNKAFVVVRLPKAGR
ncbi:MAG: Do family serine endopeptidase [Mariprofundaceae bacterium]